MAANIQPGVSEAIAGVRDDKSSDDWVLVGYEGKDTIKLLGNGTGGIEALKAHLIEGDVCYGLVKKSHEWETAGSLSATTVKFVWVYWRPESIPIMRKMKIGIFEGQMKQLFQPFHCEINASVLEEVGEGPLLQLLDNVTMRADRTGDKRATGAALGGRSSVPQVERKEFLPTGSSADTANKAVKGADLAFSDTQAFKQAVMAVRSDTDETNWCLVGYQDKKTLEVVGQGSGGLEELLRHTQDGNINYGLFRVSDKVDMTSNVRFCFIVWQPEDINPSTKARVTTHQGFVTSAFREHQPYQFDFRVSTREELTMEQVQQHIGSLTGTHSKVSNAPARPTVATQKSARTFLGGMTGEQQAMQFVDEAALKEAIARVRDDADPADYVVASFEGTKLGLREVGTGGVEALKACLPDSTFSYGLARLVERIDKSDTVKFCFIKFQPDSVAPGARGRLGVLLGAVSSVFSPYHGDVVVSDASEVTHDSVLALVSGGRRGSRG